MLSLEKINQVFNAIKENGLDAFDDESLARLLSILNEDELDEFEKQCFNELDGMDAMKRIMNIKPLVLVYIDREIHRIRTSPIYQLYIESLTNGEYRNFFKSLKIDELADLKKYVSYTVNNNDSYNVSGTKKIINMITKEIKLKEENKKPRLSEVA